MPTTNSDPKTVQGFGDEWLRFDQAGLKGVELDEIFSNYFKGFPWDSLPAEAEGFDLGCGTGRWARLVAPRVGRLHCIDPSPEVIKVARRNLRGFSNCVFHLAGVDSIPLADGTMDFGYCLGVLHHAPDTGAGIAACVRKLKSGAPLLLYLYYALDNRPWWFRRLWLFTNAVRKVVSKEPYWLRYQTSQAIAVLIYLPLARFARFVEVLGGNVENFPLAYYRTRSFYTMRTDALDRFGTRLERRFTAEQIRAMMAQAGLERIALSPSPPYWCAIGFKASVASVTPLNRGNDVTA